MVTMLGHGEPIHPESETLRQKLNAISGSPTEPAISETFET
jgi:hypothetical protein